MPSKLYDVIILGGGPAGYTAALYAARAGLSTLLLERHTIGGQMALTERVDNYPGVEIGTDGFTLGERMRCQAEQFGAETIFAEVASVKLDAQIKEIHTKSEAFSARSVILATGASPRRLGLAREQELTGYGVSYCAACDGMFYKGKTVAVVGGGNTAAADALLLSRICRQVIMIHRRDVLRATRIYQASLQQAENISFYWNSAVIELLGDKKLIGIRLQKTDGAEEVISLDGLFIGIGRIPETALFREQITLDQQGYIAADESTQTNVSGVFVAGDVRTKSLRQIVTAAADGAVAAQQAEEYLENQKVPHS